MIRANYTTYWETLPFVFTMTRESFFRNVAKTTVRKFLQLLKIVKIYTHTNIDYSYIKDYLFTIITLGMIISKRFFLFLRSFRITCIFALRIYCYKTNPKM